MIFTLSNLLEWFRLSVKVVAGLKAIVSRVVVEEAIVVCALPILEALEINLARLLFFRLIDFLAQFGQVIEVLQLVHKVELESPNDVSGVLDIAALLETLEGNGLRVIHPVETTDNDESGVGVALEFFQLANGVVNAQLRCFARRRNNLQVVKANNRRTAFLEHRGLSKVSSLSIVSS